MCEYEYENLTDQMLIDMIAFNASRLARAPAAVLAEVREDLEEVAVLVVAAAEFAEERVADAHGVADSMFISPR